MRASELFDTSLEMLRENPEPFKDKIYKRARKTRTMMDFEFKLKLMQINFEFKLKLLQINFECKLKVAKQ